MKKVKVTVQPYAGHLCVARDCLFRLNTRVGKYIVSTVGEWLRREDTKPQPIGCDRLYETMVFKAERCSCGCGFYIQKDGNDIDFEPYNTPRAAYKGHVNMVDKYIKLQEK